MRLCDLGFIIYNVRPYSHRLPHRAAARARHSLLWMWARGACRENRGSTERSSHGRVIRTSRAQQLNWIGVCKENLPRCQHVCTVLFVSGEWCIDCMAWRNITVFYHQPWTARSTRVLRFKMIFCCVLCCCFWKSLIIKKFRYFNVYDCCIC